MLMSRDGGMARDLWPHSVAGRNVTHRPDSDRIIAMTRDSQMELWFMAHADVDIIAWASFALIPAVPDFRAYLDGLRTRDVQ